MRAGAFTPIEQSLTADQLQQRLEALVYRVLTVRRSVEGAARELADFSRPRQGRFIEAVEFISQTSIELAYNFCVFAPPALPLLDEQEWQDWILYIMDKYDQGGVLACIGAMQKVADYADSVRQSRSGVALEEIAGVLERFVLGLNGRALKLAAGPETYTDTETLYLPPHIAQFNHREANFRLYKMIAAHLWAQTWFGTWRMSLVQAAQHFEQPERAVRLFHALETLRLDACLQRELPGLYRHMRALQQGRKLPSTAAWQEAATRLAAPEAGVQDSYAILPRVYRELMLPEPQYYQGVLFPERAEQTIALRKVRDKQTLQNALAVIAQEHGLADGDPKSPDALFTTKQVPDPALPEGFRAELRLHGEVVNALEDVQQVLDSIMQDFGYIPDDYLVAAGHGGYGAGEGTAKGGPGPETPEDAYRYDEWDYQRKQYRKDWCLLREKEGHPVWDDFVERTLSKHRGLLKQLYRTFEALRGEDKFLKKQPDGDEVDIDALVESYADHQAGLDASERLFICKSREERNIAVMFMVDMSGSTKGWINDIERESLVLLCESLEILGDRYAIYGFSGFTHKRCELLRVKGFNELYADNIRARISGIHPRDYTRMGVAIRHLTHVLSEVEARTKLLISLSDGRPDDQDGYRGRYGIEDTRRALIEARFQGIHPFCITIDDEALEYLPYMYGPASFVLINKVDKLPYQVSDIYRRITT